MSSTARSQFWGQNWCAYYPWALSDRKNLQSIPTAVSINRSLYLFVNGICVRA